MADTSDIKNGLALNFKEGIYVVVYFQHVKPGKGNAFVRTKMKSLSTGKVIENTFTAGEKIDVANVERRPYQFLYMDESGYHFMHLETYEQIDMEKELIDAPEFLKEGQSVEVVYSTDTDMPLSCELPMYVTLEVTYTEPGAKGNTASNNALKQATLETGAIIMVPLFIETGTKIKVDTRDKSYGERVKD